VSQLGPIFFLTPPIYSCAPKLVNSLAFKLKFVVGKGISGSISSNFFIFFQTSFAMFASQSFSFNLFFGGLIYLPF
jgi:hypothetical protein